MVFRYSKQFFAITAASASLFAASESVNSSMQNLTLKAPSPIPALHTGKLTVTAGVSGTLSSPIPSDSAAARGVHWETGVLVKLPQFSVYGNAAFQHGIGSAVYTVLTDSSSAEKLKTARYGSPIFSIEALKSVAESRPFSLTLGLGGTVGYEFGQKFLDSKTGTASSSAPASESGPFSGSFYGTALEEFSYGSYSWGMQQRLHWNWSETGRGTVNSGLSMAEQGFSVTLKKMHRIHAGLGVHFRSAAAAQLYRPVSVSLGYTWIGRLK